MTHPIILGAICLLPVVLTSCASPETRAAGERVLVSQNLPPKDAARVSACTDLGEKAYNDWQSNGEGTTECTAEERARLERATKLCCEEPVRSAVAQNLGADKTNFLCDELPKKLAQAVDAFYEGDLTVAAALLADHPEQLEAFIAMLLEPDGGTIDVDAGMHSASVTLE